MIVVLFHALALFSRIPCTILLFDTGRRARRVVFLYSSSFSLHIPVYGQSEIWLDCIFVCTGETESCKKVVRACDMRGGKTYNPNDEAKGEVRTSSCQLSCTMAWRLPVATA